jgi:hypothetical protein
VRQEAIDRFNAPGAQQFVFLLSTRYAWHRKLCYGRMLISTALFKVRGRGALGTGCPSPPCFLVGTHQSHRIQVCSWYCGRIWTKHGASPVVSLPISHNLYFTSGITHCHLLGKHFDLFVPSF